MAKFPVDLKSELSEFNREICVQMILIDRMKNRFTLSESRQRFFTRRNILAEDIHRSHHSFGIDSSDNTNCIVEFFAGDVAHGKSLHERFREGPYERWNKLVRQLHLNSILRKYCRMPCPMPACR